MLYASQKDGDVLEDWKPSLSSFPHLALAIWLRGMQKEGTNPPFNYTAHFIISPQILLISFTDFVYISGVF